MRARGFTLVEMVVVLAILATLSVIGAHFVAGPVRGFVDQARRAELTDAAALALLRMGRDIRAALPNSIRVNAEALELLHVVDGARYRSEPPGADDDRLDFSVPDATFNTLGVLGGVSAASYANHHLAIYPLRQVDGSNTYFDPYVAADQVMTPAQTITVSPAAAPGPGDGESRVSLSSAQQFALASPAQRVYLVSGPVSYVCSGGQLLRYSGYGLSATQPAAADLSALTAALVVDQVESCRFSYQALDQRRALARLEVVLESDGERVRLSRQVHLDNTP